MVNKKDKIIKEINFQSIFFIFFISILSLLFLYFLYSIDQTQYNQSQTIIQILEEKIIKITDENKENLKELMVYKMKDELNISENWNISFEKLENTTFEYSGVNMTISGLQSYNYTTNSSVIKLLDYYDFHTLAHELVHVHQFQNHLTNSYLIDFYEERRPYFDTFYIKKLEKLNSKNKYIEFHAEYLSCSFMIRNNNQFSSKELERCNFH